MTDEQIAGRVEVRFQATIRRHLCGAGPSHTEDAGLNLRDLLRELSFSTRRSRHRDGSSEPNPSG